MYIYIYQLGVHVNILCKIFELHTASEKRTLFPTQSIEKCIVHSAQFSMVQPKWRELKEKTYF